jgi:organic hydroperoxide reductase OsmC/OhrA
VDPEEALVAAIASCHMLTFLFLAGKAGYTIAAYTDAAVGTLGRNAQGRQAILGVKLHPQIDWAGPNSPTPEAIEALHHAAHAECFIANSVACPIHW